MPWPGGGLSRIEEDAAKSVHRSADTRRRGIFQGFSILSFSLAGVESFGSSLAGVSAGRPVPPYLCRENGDGIATNPRGVSWQLSPMGDGRVGGSRKAFPPRYVAPATHRTAHGSSPWVEPPFVRRRDTEADDVARLI